MTKTLSRRNLIKGLGLAPLYVPGAVLGLNGAIPPSEKITLGVVGFGSRSALVLSHFMNQPEIHVPAVCDCFADRREKGKRMVDEKYGNTDCAAYRFHEKLLERADIDAVLVETGDRWHAVGSLLAMRAGKDVYCEKPFSLTIGEGRALVNAVNETGRVWQCGTQRRSNPGYKFVVDVVRSGRIGKLHSITTSNGLVPNWRRTGIATPEPEPAPEIFDYKRWMGQAPLEPYSKIRVDWWRINWATGGGSLADMGAHYLDFAQWAHDSEDTGPIEFEGEGKFVDQPSFNNTPYYYNVRTRYKDGVRIYIDAGPKSVRFDGDEGWIRLTDNGEITTDSPEVLEGLKPPDSHWKTLIPHLRDFIECVKTRKRPVSHAEAAHRSHTIFQCANLCLRLGRRLHWDPDHERFIDDETANSHISRPMRAPWSIG